MVTDPISFSHIKDIIMTNLKYPLLYVCHWFAKVPPGISGILELPQHLPPAEFPLVFLYYRNLEIRIFIVDATR